MLEFLAETEAEAVEIASTEYLGGPWVLWGNPQTGKILGAVQAQIPWDPDFYLDSRDLQLRFANNVHVIGDEIDVPSASLWASPSFWRSAGRLGGVA